MNRRDWLRRIAYGAALGSAQRWAEGSAQVLALGSLTALADALPFAIDARRFLMATEFLDGAAPALGTSPRLRERMSGLAASLDGCRARAFEIFSRAPVPDGELHDKWERLRSDVQQRSPAAFMQQLMELYWACLSRLARLVTDAEAASEGREHGH